MHTHPNFPRRTHFALGVWLLALGAFLTVFSPSAYAQTPGDIIGVVFQDLNTNGARDGGEPGIADVVIRLRNSADQIIATTQTDADGEFAFTGLGPDVYTVLETDPSGYVSTTPNEVVINLASGVTATVEFGNLRTSTVVPPLNGYIWGFVIHDLNGNGQADPDEVGLAGAEVSLFDESNTLLDAVTSDIDGFFDFGVYPVGNYTLSFEPPPGTNSTSAPSVTIQLEEGQLITQIFTAREPYRSFLPKVIYQ